MLDGQNDSRCNTILQVIPTLNRGGAERQCVNLSTGLARRGYNVHLALLTQSRPSADYRNCLPHQKNDSLEQELLDAGVVIHFIGKRFKLDPVALLHLIDVISEIKPQVVHSWLFAGNCYSRVAAALSGVEKIFANERCVDPWKSSWQLAIDRFLARSCQAITTNSAAVADFYAKNKIGTYSNQNKSVQNNSDLNKIEPFTVIPNGIDVSKLIEQSGRESRADILSELNLPSNAIVIGIVARMWQQKRLKWAIWSMDILHRLNPNAHMVIIGDGPQKQALMRYRQLYQSEQFVHFLGVRNDVPRLMKTFDVLWLTSLYEGQSNAVLEAMALGVPVVCSTIEGITEIITHQKNGFLVDPNDIPGFARWTTQLLENPQLRNAVIAAASDTIEKQFDLETMISRYEQLYTS